MWKVWEICASPCGVYRVQILYRSSICKSYKWTVSELICREAKVTIESELGYI